MGDNPSHFTGDDNLPVELVSWDDVQSFITKLNDKEGTTKYRLPSEAEWEYACRAGTTTRYSFGDNESELSDYAWYWDNSDSQTHPVGQKRANPWGLSDMHGNVWEWVQDCWQPRLPSVRFLTYMTFHPSNQIMTPSFSACRTILISFRFSSNSSGV